jgi:hypothetical protein
MALDTIKGMAPGALESAGILIGGAEEEAKKARAESQKAGQAKIMSDYGEALFSKPAPHFQASQEDMSGFAALGSLLAVSGAMMGMKGKTSGIMAMNAISGMMKGYQQGRKDLYEQERQKFEMSMKDWERERSQIKEAFDMALKMAPTNYKGATEFLNKTLASMGVQVPRASLERNGLTQTVGSFGQALDNAGEKAKQIAGVTGGGPKITKEQAAQYGIPELEGMTYKQADTFIKATEARQKGEAEAEKSAVEMRLKTAQAKEAEGKAATGGLTPYEFQQQQLAKQRAEYLVKNKLVPQTEKDRDALAQYAPDYVPPSRTYGEMAVFERAVPGSAAAFKTEREKTDANTALQSVGTAAKVLKDAQNPNIKFGEAPVLWENIKQRVRANLEGMGFKDDGTATYYTQLNNGQTLGDYIRSQIAQTPVDPNDQNAVFQKETAFSNFDIERAARGGSVLPVGFLKVAGPFLNPKQFTKEAFSGVYADRISELDRKLASFGFDAPERDKIYSEYGKLIGYPIVNIGTKSSSLPSGLPEGSILIGTTPDGKKNVYKSPDGKQFAVPKEGQ